MALTVEEHEDFVRMRLPAAAEADYRFVLYLYDDGEPQICAELVRGDPDAYFWAWHFEADDFPSLEERDEAFVAAVPRLLTSRTRIRQKRGFLGTSFWCEIRDGEAWSAIGTSLFGVPFGARPPRTKQKITDYESQALLPG